MKHLLVIALFIVSPEIFSQDKKEPKKDFQERKAKWSSHLETKIKNLTTTKTCVDSAATAEELKACRVKREKNFNEKREKAKKMWKDKKEKKDK